MRVFVSGAMSYYTLGPSAVGRTRLMTSLTLEKHDVYYFFFEIINATTSSDWGL